MLETLVTWLVNTIGALGYPGVIILMALESSFFPFPSEVVVPPAGYLAAQGEMNLGLVIGAALLGSLVGALANYLLAVWLGRPLLHRLAGKTVFMKEGSLDRAEDFFRRHGEISTFVGRLVPVIRQYISLPAGLSRMNLARFSIYTALGAGIWCVILALIGWYLGQNAELLRNEEVHRLVRLAFFALVPVLVVVLALYVWRHRRKAEGGGVRE